MMSMSSILTELLIILALVLMNAFFAGAEIAILSLRKTKLQELLGRGDRRAIAVKALRDNPERFLATVQVGITLVGASAAAFGGATLAGVMAGGLRRLGLGGYAEEISLLAVIGLVTYLSVVLGELVPKSMALHRAEVYALWAGRILLALSRLMRPLVWFLTASSNAVLRLFDDRTSFTEARLSPEELQQLVDEAVQAGALDPETGDIASRSFDFGRLRARAVMVPRQRLVAVARRTFLADVRRIIVESGHSRLPVYEGTLDDIVGYVVAKDVLARGDAGELPDAILRPAYIVPESAPAIEVLREMQRRRNQLAIVVDERGTVAGLITIEDLLEELVGEILAEHEKPEELIRAEADGSAVVRADTPIHDANRTLDISLPELDGATTVGGLCMALAEAIPAAGERLWAPDGTMLEILEATPRRVRLVRVRRRAEGVGAESTTGTPEAPPP